ncbi:transcription factor HES-1-like [Lampris incognitus]|uniref:transcription factor HES-1-like n=1 Tax=Lampris incognitus TaxID=2546036 RepID=UPI0024B48A3D|nr:transcription factor HES-1-like [Lampris incognitus]
MPAGTFERTSPSSVAATPTSADATPAKPRAFSESRKSSKPIMEKRRRARINESLGQLKTLILDALKKDSSRHSKLEKADILEMTVKHLRSLQRLQMTAAVNTDPSILSKYKAGFNECVGEVTRFLSSCEGVNTEVRTRLLSHLAGCMSQMNSVNLSAQRQVPIYTLHPSVLGPIPGALPQVNGVPCKNGSAVAVPPEAVKMYSGFKVMPTPDGQFALLIPSTAFTPLMSVQSSLPALAAAMSPVAPPPGTSDSVWRPW